MPHTDLPCDADMVKTKGWCDGNCSKLLAGGASECHTLCDRNTSCVGYSYIAAEQMCCQKRWVGTKVNNPGATAGVKPAVVQQVRRGEKRATTQKPSDWKIVPCRLRLHTLR